MKIYKSISISCIVALSTTISLAQTVNWIKSSEGKYWQEQKITLQDRTTATPDIIVDTSKDLLNFKAWGTCFNELGWDALNLLPGAQKEKVLKQLFKTDDDLRFSLGRFSMNANDYARDWYSADEVDGDFQLKHFNIERDKRVLIPYIKAAQQYNPNMSFWISPWSPPSWMKINHYYSVRSDIHYNKLSSLSDIALFENTTTKTGNVFPEQLSVNDYLIQDSRYLKAYAEYFCKFIDAYAAENIPIKTVMYQNEAYSYTIYPGCAWTADGSIRFNTEYLAPALKEKHPEVSLYLGTINTDRYEVIDQILSDPRMPQTIKGVGFQWEGGKILPRIRKKYPQYNYVQTESECGWGTFDWKSAEHTFGLINHYLANGCVEYTFWNAILSDEGVSGWGWKQNALIRVNSITKTLTYTPEYYSVKHYSHYISAGSKLLAYKEAGVSQKPVLVFLTPEGKTIIIAGNFKDETQKLIVKSGARYLNITLDKHSLNTIEIDQ
jgi:glucosylceramidase